MTNDGLGFVTACHSGDYLMVKATCASIRYFMPDSPICVIVDGKVDISELVSAYNVQTIHIERLREHDLSNILTGSSKTKLAALWYGPFERYLYLDSDAIVWGDVRRLADLDNYNWNIFAESNLDNVTDWEAQRKWIDHFHYDTSKINLIDPKYRWQARQYFCAGVYGAVRNAICVERFLEVQAAAERHPDVFKFMDQGMLNYLVHTGRDCGKINYKVIRAQFIPVDHGPKRTKEHLEWKGRIPDAQAVISNPCIVHFCGKKPLIQYRGGFSTPFTHFRLMHQQRFLRKSAAQAWFAILAEEARVFGKRAKNKLRRITGIGAY